MTEAEWLASTDPESMLEFLSGKGSDRKMRLRAVAFCLNYWKYLSDERSRNAVELASQIADGTAPESERERAFVQAYSAATWTYDSDAAAEVAALTCGEPEQVLEVPWRAMRAFAFDIYQNPRNLGCVLLFDIFGPLLFRRIAVDLRWLTSDVLGLARGIYEDRAFDRMPILADALMDAGCEDEEILRHCRAEMPHVRGCWVVDLLTARS